MRALLTFLLSLLLLTNAAHAGLQGICDALGHLPASQGQHRDHPGHHTHGTQVAEHGAIGEPASGADTATTPHDYCHAHASFSPLRAAKPALPGALGRHILSPPATAALSSIAAARLERPPRASRA